METILFSVPYLSSTGEDTWLQSTYWWVVDKKGVVSYTLDYYSDGDHEDIEESDLPSSEDVEKAWKLYADICHADGTDPLNEYNVSKTKTSKHTWQAQFRVSLLGIICIGLRRRGRGKWLSPNDVPSEVIDYLDLRRYTPVSKHWIYDDNEKGNMSTSAYMDYLTGLCEKNEDVTIHRGRLKVSFPVDETKDIANSTYKRNLRGLISRHRKLAI